VPSKARILDGNSESEIDECIEMLRAGSVIGIPTETVYGLAAIATNSSAINLVFTTKERPTSHPLILHIADVSMLDDWATNISSETRALCKKFWPGPLTLILHKSDKVLTEVTGGRDTVAIRCPNHSVTTKLLKKLNDAVVAPSANKFGKVSPTTAKHVVNDLGSDISIVLDGGDCSIGLESTIIDCTTTPPQLLRTGAITAEQILRECNITVVSASGESRAPGMLEKHYAPVCRVVLVSSSQEGLIEAQRYVADGFKVRLLDLTEDLDMFARLLYSSLRTADKDGITVAIVVRAPMKGIGFAINERLEKAANSFLK
jgi:L-threonylcarbamoyladenylate synthase